jgi:hypothetical protein
VIVVGDPQRNERARSTPYSCTVSVCRMRQQARSTKHDAIHAMFATMVLFCSPPSRARDRARCSRVFHACVMNTMK